MEYTKEQIDKLKEVLYERAVDDNDDICHHAITYINNLEKQLRLYGVESNNKVNYKEGFELAKKYIEESPCDHDIHKEQLACWDKYQIWLKHNNLT